MVKPKSNTTSEVRAHRWALTIAVVVSLIVYVLILVVLVWHTWPLLLVPVLNFGLIGILIALVPLTIQLGSAIWQARGADWRVTFVRHSSRRVPNSHEYEAQYEFVVENRGVSYGVLKYIQLRLPNEQPFTHWDLENTLRCYLNPPAEERKPLKSLALAPKSAHYIYVCFRVVEEQILRPLIEYATKTETGKRYPLQELKEKPFHIDFVFTRQALQLLGNETVLATQEFTLGDDSFQRPKEG